MNTRIQVKIDRYVGWLLCVSLKFFVRLAGMVLRINHRLDRKFERIVVCKFKGMGSVVQASALLRSLRNSYPEAEIVFVTGKANEGILKAYPNLVNRVLLVNDDGILALLRSTVQLLFGLWKIKPQVYLDLEVYSNFSSLICTLSAATNRLGFYKSDKDYRSGLYTHLMVYNIKAPLMEIYLQMGRILPDLQAISKLEKPVYEIEATQNMWRALGSEGAPLLVVNPNASDLRLERRWTPEGFRGLIERLLLNYPKHFIVLTGSPAETDYAAEIAKPFAGESRVINSAGKLKLNGLLALIDHADVVITNDTGPLHLALAFRKPVTGLFGPCSPTQYGQMETCVPIYKNVYCSPCVHEFAVPPCLGNNQCMKQIQVSEVLVGVEKALKLGAELQPEPLVYSVNGQTLGYFKNRP